VKAQRRLHINAAFPSHRGDSATPTWNGLEASVFSRRMGGGAGRCRIVPSGDRLPREIDRKLRLTAALLGVATRKDLAKAFQRVNPATPFDVDRAHKWLQGRARPREQQLYDDWAKLLDLGRPGQWIAECDSEALLEAICARHERDQEALRHQVDGSAMPASQHADRGLPLAGTYACYHNSVSPYYRGRLIRGELTIAAGPTPQRPSATYEETMATGGRFRLDGGVTLRRALHVDVSETAGEARITFLLFPPAPLISVLAGIMCCAPFIGPEGPPSVTRIAIVRLPTASPRLRDAPAPLAPQASVAEDLTALGLPIAEPTLVDERAAAFLGSGDSGGLDQIASAAYRALAEVFDRNWLVSAAGAAPPASASRHGAVLLAQRRTRGQ
jgi:hypothetical protein